MANSTNPPTQIDDGPTVGFTLAQRQMADRLTGLLKGIQTHYDQYTSDKLASNLPGTGITVMDGAGVNGDQREPVTDADVLNAVLIMQMFLASANQVVGTSGETVLQIMAKFAVNPQNYDF